LYISFYYKNIEYNGVALAQIHQEHDVYLFYIDSNVLPRITKITHLKKIKNLKNENIDAEFLKKELDKYETKVNLFSFEGRKFIEPIRLKYKEIIENFEKKLSEDNNFNLKKYSRR
tara:strand:+ start:186 stop:533 length:348 start_codon:yes stop_codon:yes gene_type:complete